MVDPSWDEEELLGDDDCGPPVHSDVVDEALEQIIESLVTAGYDDADAEDAVWSALEQLHAADQISDTPDIDESEEAKTAWIFNTVPRLKQKLVEMGLDFSQE